MPNVEILVESVFLPLKDNATKFMETRLCTSPAVGAARRETMQPNILVYEAPFQSLVLSRWFKTAEMSFRYYSWCKKSISVYISKVLISVKTCHGLQKIPLTSVGVYSGVTVIMAFPDVHSISLGLILVEGTQTFVPSTPPSHWNLRGKKQESYPCHMLILVLGLVVQNH